MCRKDGCIFSVLLLDRVRFVLLLGTQAPFCISDEVRVHAMGLFCFCFVHGGKFVFVGPAALSLTPSTYVTQMLLCALQKKLKKIADEYVAWE